MWLFLESFFSSPTSLLTTTLLTLLTWHYMNMLRKRMGMPPGPLSLPLVGTSYTFPKDMTRWPLEMAKVLKKYGSIVTHQLGTGSCIIMIGDPKIYREVFSKNSDVAGRPYAVTRTMTQKIQNPFFPKSGLVFGDYDEQLKLQRNISMVVLRNLGYGKKSIENKILEEADHIVRAFKETNQKSFNPKHLLDNAVANIICSMLFGKRFEYGDEEFERLKHDMDDFFMYNAMTLPLDYFWFLKYIPGKKKQLVELKKVSDRLNEYIKSKLDETKEAMQSGEERSDFMSLYLTEVQKSDGKLDDRSHQLVKDFFAAGAETTSTTLTWCLYFMAKCTNVQEKARNCLTEVIGERKPVLKDREKLPYIEATITEVLRVTPTAPGSLPHSTITDTEICGYKIPKGTTVQALFSPITSDPDLFPEPDILKPERHLDADGKYVRNDLLTPFGVGRRSCLGEQMAKQELFLFFTHLIQSFEIKVPEGEELPPQEVKWFITNRAPPFNIEVVPLH